MFYGLLLILFAYLATAGPSGKLGKVPIDYQQSWWLSESPEKSSQWKRDSLKLSNTKLRLHKLIDREGMETDVKIVMVNELGNFVLPDDMEGEYLLQATHKAYVFPPVLVSAEKDRAEHVYTLVDETMGVQHLLRRLPTLLIRPLRLEAPYPPPAGFNPLSLLKNPMVLMGLVSLFVSYVLPKMMDSSAMEEYRQETQGDQPQMKSAFLENAKNLKVN